MTKKHALRIVLSSLCLGITTSALASNTFENCADWINNQVDFDVLGAAPSGKQIVKFSNDGSPQIIEKGQVDCLNCGVPVPNQTVITFAENEGIRSWIQGHPDASGIDPKPKDAFKDTLKIERNSSGKVIQITIDHVTGGRGTQINGTKYLYYHHVNQYQFAYDSKGCYPSNAAQWLYVGKDAESRVTNDSFDFGKCLAFERLWSQLKFQSPKDEDGNVRNYPGTNIPIRKPVLPPSQELRKPLVESALLMAPYSPDATADFKKLESTDETSNQISQNWDLLMNMSQSRCEGYTGFRDSTSKNLRFFLDARKPVISGTGAQSQSNSAAPALPH